MRNILYLTVLVFTLLAGDVFAWNSFGHMTVAAIAYDKLTPTARGKVAKLLKLNPMYATWVAGVSDQERDRVAFIMAATWPDAIKSPALGYTNDGEHPSGPDASLNIGYTDKLEHRYWHFVDTPFSPDGTPLVQPAVPNAKTRIATFKRSLRSPSTSDDVKSYDLVWLIHLVGDVHQPLHATSRFDKDQPNGDSGGNRVALCVKPCRNELHAFWDDVLGTSKTVTSAEKRAARLQAAPSRAAAIRGEGTWVTESFEIAQKSVYVAPIGVGPGPFTLDTRYRTTARAVAEKRVALAGARLAQLLKDVLK